MNSVRQNHKTRFMVNSEIWFNILKSSPIPIAVFELADKSNSLLFANDAYCGFFGVLEGEIANKSVSEIFLAKSIHLKYDVTSDLIKSLQRTVESGEPDKVNNVILIAHYPNRAIPETLFFDIEHTPIKEEGVVKYVSQSLLHNKQAPDVSFPDVEKGTEQLSRAELIETILQNLPIGIAVNRIDNGEATLVNRQFSATYGWSEQDLIDVKSFFDKVYPDPIYREKILRRVMEDINSGEESRMEWENIEVTTSTGEKRIINAKNIPLFDQNLMISTVVDITLQARQADEIRRAKVNQETLINSSDDLIWSVDTDGKIITANKAFLRNLKASTGRDLQEGDYVQDNVFGDEINQKWKTYYDRALGGESYTVKEQYFSHLRKGIEYSVVSFNPMRNEEGEIFGAACYSKDITTDTIALMALQKARNETHKIMESSLDVICTIDADGCFASVSAAAIKIWGYHPEELVGRRYMELVYEEDITLTIETSRSIMDGMEMTNFENRYVRKNGSLVTMVWSARWDDTDQIMYCIAKDATEREKVFQRIKENESKLLAAQKIAKVGYWQSVPDSKGLYWSDEVYNIWGLDKNTFQLDYDSYFETIHPDDRAEFLSSRDQALSSGVQHDVEHRIILPDGSFKWVHALGNLVKNDNGDILIFEGTVQDITQDKLALEKLLISEARHRGIFESQTNYMIRTDLAGNYSFYNNKFIKDFGWLYEGKEIIGMNCMSSILDYHHERVAETVAKCFADLNKVFQVFIDKPMKDGKGVVSTLWDFICLTDSKGQPSEIQCVGIDVSEWKKTQEALEESNARYEYVTRATSDAIWDWDLRTDEMYRGSGYQTLFGYSYKNVESRGTFLEEHIHPEDKEDVLRNIEAVINGNKETWILEYRLRKSNGKYAFVQDKGILIRDKSGTPIKMVGAMQDISEGKIADKQKQLHAEISRLFNQPDAPLIDILGQVLEQILNYGDISLAEIWLPSSDKRQINLTSRCTKEPKFDLFYQAASEFKRFVKGAGLPGKVWASREVELWDNIDTDSKFLRHLAAKSAALKTAVGLPLIYNDEFIGVLILFHQEKGESLLENVAFRHGFCQHLSSEIKRKQLDQELKQIFSFAPDVISVAGTDGYFKKINPAACEMLEYSEEELLSKPVSDFVHPDDRNMTWQVVRSLATLTDTYYYENRYITKSGKVIWLAWTSTPSPEEGLMFAVAKNITEKKNLEVLLERSNSLAELGSWEIDFQNNSLYWSSVTKQIHEVDADFEPDIETAINFYMEGFNRDSIRNAVEQGMKNGTVWDLELQIVTAKGNERWVRALGEAEFLDEKCVKLYGSFQNITHRKVAELELLKIYDEKNTILESIGDGFFAVDKDWIVNYWNKEAEKLLGVTKKQALGNNLWDVFDHTAKSTSYSKYQEAIDTNQVIHFVDYYPSLHKWYEVSAYPSVDGLSVFFKDITERKIYDIQVRDLNSVLRTKVKELAVSNRELEQFAYVASHDLQEPLRMISSFLTQLQRKYDDQLDVKAHQYIHFAVDGAKRMRQIILDLLDFSRVGRGDVENELVNLNEVINEILILFRKNIEDTKTLFVISDLPSINVSKASIRQLLQNLVSNAMKYQSPENSPLVEIGFTEQPDYWEFWVKDNGIGISSDYFEKIFIIFQRLHTKDQYSGTGMGLAICRKIVENIGGKLWVESAEGEGSVFYFTIPKAIINVNEVQTNKGLT